MNKQINLKFIKNVKTKITKFGINFRRNILSLAPRINSQNG